jgi:hypothetical protein
MARSTTKLINCPGGALSSTQRIKPDARAYDTAFKLTGQPLSSREGEIVLLVVPKRKDGAKAPAARRKTSGR